MSSFGLVPSSGQKYEKIDNYSFSFLEFESLTSFYSFGPTESDGIFSNFMRLVGLPQPSNCCYISYISYIFWLVFILDQMIDITATFIDLEDNYR